MIKLGELKHLSNPRKRNQPRFREYWRKKAEKAKKSVKERFGKVYQRW